MYPSGKNVRSAISFAMSIDPIKVMYTSASIAERILPVSATILRAINVKKRMFFSAQMTASVQNRHDSVLKSKYSMYCESGGTMIEVTAASSIAMTSTVFLLINDIIACMIS